MTKNTFTAIHLTLAAGLTGLFLAGGQAFAQSKTPQEMLARADANGDGNLEWDEIMAMRAEAFDRLDRNGDGVVNDDDAPPRALAGRFNEALTKLRAEADSNGDREITRDEMMAAPAPLFEAGDANGDGVLTAAEMDALRASAAPK